MTTILVVDDEVNIRRLLRIFLEEEGHQVLEADRFSAARLRLQEGRADLVLTDHKLPDGTGLQVLEASREADATVPVILLTAFATVELTVSAMRSGAFDVIPKPFDPEGLKAAVVRAMDHGALLRENDRLRAQVGRLIREPELLGRGPKMVQLVRMIEKVAPTPAPVLILGETGSGKELVARAVHRRSQRPRGPFIPINCAALPENLLESELFGYEKGAFTGADRAKPGLFEAAHGGTLFLDEAGEMAPALQVKLLRVLMDGQILRLGATQPRHVDVRVISATHRDLTALVAKGAFREDLYYRLAVLPLEVPPLRERPEDLPLLVAQFLASASADLGQPTPTLHPAALERLKGYPFPGNVRELRNLIERACILATGPEIGVEAFPIRSGDPGAPGLEDFVEGLPPTVDLPSLMDRFERALLVRAMREGAGVQAEAARRLGLSRSDFHYKWRKGSVQTL